jgi:hypothetical protein
VYILRVSNVIRTRQTSHGNDPATMRWYRYANNLRCANLTLTQPSEDQ